MSEIDISSVSDKGKLLRLLWEHQVVAGFFGATNGPPFNEAQVTDKLLSGDIDYFCGRAIKTDLSKAIVSPRLYDRDAGEGMFQKCVNMAAKE
jgi:hypothetical protein